MIAILIHHSTTKGIIPFLPFTNSYDKLGSIKLHRALSNLNSPQDIESLQALYEFELYYDHISRAALISLFSRCSI